VAYDKYSIIPNGLAVEGSFSLGQDINGWRQWKTTCETLRQKVFERQFTRANGRILAGDNPVSDTSNIENDSQMQNKADEMSLSRMAKVHNIF